ncbi:MAG: alkyl hydroperoxide reductase subunit F [Bdellovibrionales bacterium]|nr:alkyl hydroperoxide reductase subunit F [Bdellovibrionales bacterium]
MLEAQIQDQLKSLFEQLEQSIELSYEPSFHEDQAQLIELLEEVASTSPKIRARLLAPDDGRQSPMPQFHIDRQGVRTGITFKGIPGGHEFSSLVLAILNSDGKGKLPDPVLIDRIKKLKGPIDIKTYISLSCENCPDVVQALNQMALLHGNFRHQMVDGAYVQEEIEALSIQGVPSIVVGDKMIHSGRIQLLDLIDLLEKTFGISEGESVVVDAHLGEFDVVVLGGGPAGASAAIYSVRKGQKTALLAEKFGGQVLETRGIENLISVPYTEGPQLAAQLNQHVATYPISRFEHRRVKEISLSGEMKKIDLESGEYLTARSLIIATGAKWRELGIPGEKEYLGRGVAFCPHCDGPFYKGKKVAVIGGGNSGVEAAIDLAGIVREVVLIEYGDQLKADKILVDKLNTMSNVSVLTGIESKKIGGDGNKVIEIEYRNRQTNQIDVLPVDGIFIQIGLVPNSHFVKGLVELNAFGEIVIDGKCHTSLPGVYAAGDVTNTAFKQIIIAMGEGAKAALTAFEDRVFQNPHD